MAYSSARAGLLATVDSLYFYLFGLSYGKHTYVLSCRSRVVSLSYSGIVLCCIIPVLDGGATTDVYSFFLFSLFGYCFVATGGWIFR